MATKFELEDFIPFLNKHDPHHQYSIEKLVGGMINVTVRATKQSISPSTSVPSHDDSEPPSRFPAQSLVLKYAPPYIAGVGLAMPFSQRRQSIEAAALALFDGLLSNLRSYDITIPTLHIYDEKEHILVIEDLGKVETIEDWLQKSPTLAQCVEVGTRLGRFLVNLHMSPLTDPERFEFPDKNELIKAGIVDTIPDYLNKMDIPDADLVHGIIAKSFAERTSAPARTVFSVGDLWPPSVLLNESGSKIGIIDWEFAGLGAPLQDMAQFAAHLHLLLLTADPACAEGVRVFLKALHETYGQTSREMKAPWLSPQSVEQHIRAAWILHAREMINNAAEREWPGCIPLTAEGFLACPKRRALAKVGVEYALATQLGDSEFRERWQKELVLRPLYS
ncbi:hypothetical protein SISSUDRAFT_318903 [Sistotremastrum suecicum HHB10207 ss-3]|uniref:Aminoglycoside phosphotransferase domain-containing protein n=1 Tax=Sistotremastrum suecicum HHB10207 ss-3 TaxID=1314776 RepID=A0A166IQI4_9AGAM|nr:hypothetical protein SISSUDRAFT_318903 [Sistotremastrum suecicum HHB10207 ss-3]